MDTDTRKIHEAAAQQGELGLQDLRDRFLATDTMWLLYRRKNGSVGVQAPTGRGFRNYEHVCRQGATRIGVATGVSRKEAVRAAKKNSAGTVKLAA